MNKIITAALLLLIMPLAQASNEGRVLFENLCMRCHQVYGPPTVAPPMAGVKQHVIRVYPRREDFVNRIVQWVQQPDASRALLPGAVRRFGLMPAQPYPADQVRKVAEFIYDSDLRMPARYRQPYQGDYPRPYYNRR